MIYNEEISSTPRPDKPARHFTLSVDQTFRICDFSGYYVD